MTHEELLQWIDSPIKELLQKYMQLVMSEESVSFVCNANDGWKSDAPKFTEEEVEILQSIEKEILKYW